jgi:hypothetical protein
MLIGVQRDLTEPLAYALVALGVLLLDGLRRPRPVAAGLALGLAVLARETAVVFPLVIGLWLVLRGERRRGAALLGLGLVPYLAWIVFVRLWLGEASTAGNLTPIPFLGLFHGPFKLDHQGVSLVFVIVPAAIALVALWPSGRWSSPPWLPWMLLVANVLLQIVFFRLLYTNTYTSMGRLATGIMLAALLALPFAHALSAQRRRWLAGAAALAMAPLPVVAVQGFASLS